MAMKSTSSIPSPVSEPEQPRQRHGLPLPHPHNSNHHPHLHLHGRNQHKVDGDAGKPGGSHQNPGAESKPTALLPSLDRPLPPARNPRARLEQEEDINQHAEDFIKSFRRQLEIQRMESLENYHQMLARGL